MVKARVSKKYKRLVLMGELNKTERKAIFAEIEALWDDFFCPTKRS